MVPFEKIEIIRTGLRTQKSGPRTTWSLEENLTGIISLDEPHCPPSPYDSCLLYSLPFCILLSFFSLKFSLSYLTGTTLEGTLKVLPLNILIEIEYGKTMFDSKLKMLPVVFDTYFVKPSHPHELDIQNIITTKSVLNLLKRNPF